MTPTGLRAPELIFRTTTEKDTAKGIAKDTVADGRTPHVWSVGCLVFELVTGQPLFCVPWSDGQDETDDDQLLQLSSNLGPLPDSLFRAGNGRPSTFERTPRMAAARSTITRLARPIQTI